LRGVYTSTDKSLDNFLVKIEAETLRGIPDVIVNSRRKENLVQRVKRNRTNLHKLSGKSLPIKKIILDITPPSSYSETAGFDLPILISLAKAFKIDRIVKKRKVFATGNIDLSGKVHFGTDGAFFFELAERLNKKDFLIICPLITQEFFFLKDLFPEVTVWELENLYDLDKKVRLESLKDIISREDGRSNKFVLSSDENRIVYSKNRPAVSINRNLIKSIIYSVSGKHSLLISGCSGSGKTYASIFTEKLINDSSPAEILDLMKKRSYYKFNNSEKIAVIHPYMSLNEVKAILRKDCYKVIIFDDFLKLHFNTLNYISEIIDKNNNSSWRERRSIIANCQNEELKRYKDKVDDSLLSRFQLYINLDSNSSREKIYIKRIRSKISSVEKALLDKKGMEDFNSILSNSIKNHLEENNLKIPNLRIRRNLFLIGKTILLSKILLNNNHNTIRNSCESAKQINDTVDEIMRFSFISWRTEVFS